MLDMANARPYAEELPKATTAGVVVNGHYAPPPTDGEGQLWIRTSAIIQVSASDLYTLWRDFERAPRWKEQIISVTAKGPKISHWVMQAGSETIEWNAEVLADEPGKRIVWSSIDGKFKNAGEVVFDELSNGRGTVVTVLHEFHMGKLAAAWQTLIGRNPKQAVIEDLRRFKALAETGEIPRSSPQPHGDRGFIGERKQALYGESIPVPSEGRPV
ncbi:Polyketide cyclase / dehydrase and lipid transport [Granulicella rosea]|uniref:Polyketide cyclase / dehydrase and lipid transport n=1 Tax=Granulicella rosea TaxID=474952 RepID=A0A239ECX4_9BACT|nr:SRPBCC family protein [Granulicella rosea]SNS42359.1 Polyketide cyclase / dehydrase and lipid transport [Granulicella rosea]